MPHSTQPDRFSLRRLLALVAFVAVALAALKYAGDVWWTLLSSAALLVFLAALIVACVDRGPRQAAAIGFVLAVGFYGILLYSLESNSAGGSSELDPYAYAPTLPTTRAMRPVYQALVTDIWIDSATRLPIPNFDPQNPGNYFTGAQPMIVANQPVALQQESPDRTHFMRVAHVLWALLFGYAGAHFAAFVYRRRAARETAVS